MIQKTQGIVIRTTHYSETSVITDIYSEDFGLISCIIGGVRKARARVHANVFQIMGMVEIVFYDKHTSKSLMRIKEAKPAFIYSRIPFDIVRIALGQFMIEVIQKSIREREPNRDLYEFIISSFLKLDSPDADLKHHHLKFMIDFSRYLGFLPSDNWAASSPYFDLLEGRFVGAPANSANCLNQEDSRIFFDLIRLAETDLGFDYSKEERSILLENILLFYKLHIEKFPEIRSFGILKQIFS